MGERKGNLQGLEIKQELKDRAIILSPDLMGAIEILALKLVSSSWGKKNAWPGGLEKQVADTCIPTYSQGPGVVTPLYKQGRRNPLTDYPPGKHKKLSAQGS